MKVFMLLACHWSIVQHNELVSFLFIERVREVGPRVTNDPGFQSIPSVLSLYTDCDTLTLKERKSFISVFPGTTHNMCLP